MSILRHSVSSTESHDELYCLFDVGLLVYVQLKRLFGQL
jgi:hypothetical protein